MFLEEQKHRFGLRLNNSVWPENTTGVCECVCENVCRALSLTDRCPSSVSHFEISLMFSRVLRERH